VRGYALKVTFRTLNALKVTFRAREVLP